MHLNELKATLFNVETMEPHFSRIREEVAKGNRTVDFYDLDNDVKNSDPQSLSSAQVTYLKTQGYTVDWEKHMDRQWVVSGWF